MIGLLIACSALARFDDPPRSSVDQPPAAKAALSPAQAEALARYNEQMASPPKDAAGHWKMAAWCEQNGLRAEAYYHFGRVIELDPKRDAAWQKLGFKKVAGRWLTAEQVASEAKQKLADKEWSTKLKKWHKDVHRGRKQGEARAGLERVTDPAAVPSIYREFGGGGPVDQDIALGVLGNIDGPIASKAIAVLAVYGKTAAVRRHATELLRGRPSEEFLDLLISLMRDTLKYEVRPVGGPGSPGILFVEGERFNVQRFYAPPAASINPRPGDLISYDDNGFPVISRTNTISRPIGYKPNKPGTSGPGIATDVVTDTTETVSVAGVFIEAERAAMSAQAQLAADVALIEGSNDATRRFNDLVMGVAQTATGKNPGRTAKEWRDFLAQGQQGRYPRPRPTAKPTVNDLVPLDYVPNLAAMVSFQAETRLFQHAVADS